MMTSNVAVVPDAPGVKLPFIHSKFKPRSKFAKTFNGCSRTAKARAQGLADSNSDTKLPRITYNAGDSRTLITFGARKRGVRREYPGFAGQSKILKRNGNSRHFSKPEISSARDSWDDSKSDSVVWVSYSEREGIKESDALTAFPSKDTTGRLVIKPNRTRSNSESTREPLPDLNSLIILEDDEDTETRPNSVIDSFRRKDTVVPNEEDICESDPFAKNVDSKLKDSRGKSGVKRNRAKRPDHQPRPLGDVMTAERFNELLSPRRKGHPLKFS